LSGPHDERRRFASYGQILDVTQVGCVQITRRYGCIRRDQFEIVAPPPFPPALRDWLARRGTIAERAALYVVEVPNVFQITVAPFAGRAMLMPKYATNLTFQADAAREVGEALDAMFRDVSCPGHSGPTEVEVPGGWS